jgi:Winged helix DNA-binding domain
MPRPDIARQRLINQGLVKPTLKTATEVVARLGAVQAQDYGASKWGIAQRTAGLTDSEIEREIDDGMIIRTHVLRPTWHFVVAADIGWMLALSAPRVHAANAYWYRWLEVDDALARRSRTVLTKALRDGKQLTRAELGQVLTRARIQITSPQRLACIIMRAELEGVICSGARRGKQFTYALLENAWRGRRRWSGKPRCSSSRADISRPADPRLSMISRGGPGLPRRTQSRASRRLRSTWSTSRSMADRTGFRPQNMRYESLPPWRICCRTTMNTSSG